MGDSDHDYALVGRQPDVYFRPSSSRGRIKTLRQGLRQYGVSRGIILEAQPPDATLMIRISWPSVSSLVSGIGLSPIITI